MNKPEQGLLIHVLLRDLKRHASGHEAQKRQAGKETATTAKASASASPVAPRRRHWVLPRTTILTLGEIRAARARSERAGGLFRIARYLWSGTGLRWDQLPQRHRPCQLRNRPHAQIGVRKETLG